MKIQPPLNLLWKSVLFGLIFFCGWFIVKSLLASDRGIDFTDESYYLLEADPPTKWATLGLPFGWHTGLLYRVCGYDIAHFRTIGGVFLLCAAAYSGYYTAKLALQCSSEGKAAKHSIHILIKLLVAAVSAVGALMFYADLLRVPGYNWLNLFGIYVSTGGVFSCATLLCNREKPELINYIIPITITALGVFLTIPAKPTTAIGIMTIGFIVFYCRSSLRQAVGMIATLTILVMLLVVIAVILGVWPINFIEIFMRFVNSKAPSLIAEQSIAGAVISALKVPIDFFKHMSTVAYVSTVAAALICVSTIIGIIRGEKLIERLSIIYLFVVALICLSENGVFDSLSGVAIHHFNRPHPVTAGLTIVLICSMLALAITITSNKCIGLIGDNLKFLLLFSIIIPSLAFLFAFGSGHGAYNQACLASGNFTVSSAAVLLVAPFTCRTKTIIVAILFAYALLLSAGVIIDGHRLPYRCPPIAQNTIQTEFGPNGSKLFLHPKMAERLNSLDQNFKIAGGIPKALLPLVWTWSPGITYSLRSALPACNMLTIFGYQNSVDLALYNLSHRMVSFEGSKAWILLGDGMEWYGLTEQQKAQRPINMADLLTVAKAFTKGIGRSFPDDYIRVFKVEGLEAWRPKSGIN